MVVVTHQTLGPTVIDKAREAKIPIITIDDTIVDSANVQNPHVGLPTTETGIMGGHALAKIAKERGFFGAGHVVKVMQIDMSFLSVVHDRTVGYKQALQQDLPQLKDSDFIVQDSKTGMFEENLPVASAILASHPEVTHWIVTGINDDGALAPLRVFEEAGFPLKNVLSCGLGGYKTSYEEFQKTHDSYIVTKLQPFKEGQNAVQILYDFITKKKAMPGDDTGGGRRGHQGQLQELQLVVLIDPCSRHPAGAPARPRGTLWGSKERWTTTWCCTRAGSASASAASRPWTRWTSSCAAARCTPWWGKTAPASPP